MRIGQLLQTLTHPSGAWLVDLGVFTPVCNSTSSKVKRNALGHLPFRML